MFHWGVQSAQPSLINSINNVESKLLSHLFSQGAHCLVGKENKQAITTWYSNFSNSSKCRILTKQRGDRHTQNL